MDNLIQGHALSSGGSMVTPVGTAASLVSPQGCAVLEVMIALTPGILRQTVITDVQGAVCPMNIVDVPSLYVPSAVITLDVVTGNAGMAYTLIIMRQVGHLVGKGKLRTVGTVSQVMIGTVRVIDTVGFVFLCVFLAVIGFDFLSAMIAVTYIAGCDGRESDVFTRVEAGL
jgi:hypothetical protein